MGTFCFHSFEAFAVFKPFHCINAEHAYSKDGGLAVLKGNIAQDGCVVKTAGVDESIWKFVGPAKVFDSQEAACDGILRGKVVSGDVVVITHGFAITYKDRTGIVPPADVDVILIAPKGSGTSLRTMFLEGRGLNSSFAIFQDATGKAWDRVVALGIGVGSGYLFETTFKKEVYSDLTGERGTLMGAIQGLLLAQYETLRENGHTPSEAFNETVEELTQSLMPLFAKNGMDWMYANCSTTAQRGALDWMGPFHDASKPVFEKLYSEVKQGHALI